MTTPNFTGIWRLELARSVLKVETPREILFKIEQHGAHFRQRSLTVRKDGSEERGDFEFTVGAETESAIRGMQAVVRARWDGAVLIVESRVFAPGGELEFRDHWSFSNDGATLTMSHSDDELAGQVSVFEHGSDADAKRFD
jgi:hypothetical protein